LYAGNKNKYLLGMSGLGGANSLGLVKLDVERTADPGVSSRTKGEYSGRKRRVHHEGELL